MIQDVFKENKWYLVQCKPRQTFRAELHLTNQGYHCFHPTYPVKKKVRTNGTIAIQTTIEPLFPHYLFVSLSNLDSWYTIRSTRGVKSIVTFNGIPGSVSHSILEGIRYHCNVLNGLEPEPMFKEGQRVRITEGCFKELEAIVAANTGEERVILLLNLFNREQQIELPITSIAAFG
ncbi:transcription/translation regulatory transformer protein RfaH [Legionella impletisoli]|uniref:Transcription antitermination protein RfaH n=1 Tax=Legionella impletisoli TaxID=343510 RepID=A0A917JRQ4_9GAMM|nr:transcription/translation regulatory transformer protein RfaH [Legionella impletisoli]GGI82235.1 transcription antitermination protein RfaH [Legionella impletisoli]